MNTDHLKKFYQKNHTEKIEALVEAGVISAASAEKLKNQQFKLPKEVADHMVENYLFNYELPLGVAMNFVVDGQEVVIPMVTEEPSVIAAASRAGKIIGQAGGFHTEFLEANRMGQLVFFDVPDLEQAKATILTHEKEILNRANEAHPSIVRWGGGAQSTEVRIIQADAEQKTPEMLVVHINIDTQEAMGANIVNTMMEGAQPFVEQLVGVPALMAILSNYATGSLVTARCEIAPDLLTRGEFSGEWVRDQMIRASQWATADPYRAVTHNKGLMNGVTALVLATGNDTRAVEAGVHAYAARSGQYRAFSTWSKNDAGNLVGEVTLPLALGTVGGTMATHPTVALTQEILGHPLSKELAKITAALGLGQNFSALYALVTEGIQKGHMSLQAQSLALSAGARPEEVAEVVEILQKEKHLDFKTAKRVIKIARKN